MKTADLTIRLEYEMTGTGEPVLLISPILADGFAPLLSEHALTDKHRLITYHKRGWLGSTHTTGLVTVATHAADAAALLEHLGHARAHIAGHSSGAAVAIQLAHDRPDVVHSLTLLEPSLLSVPSATGFLAAAQPAFAAYERGDREGAVAAFLSAVSGLDWATTRAALDQLLPGAIAKAVRDADTLFGVELPALTLWQFDAVQAKRVTCPALSIVGGKTQPLWIEVAARLRAWLPRVDEFELVGSGHLLHVEQPTPVARAMAAFLARHPMRE